MTTPGALERGTRNPLPPRLGFGLSLGISAGALALMMLLPGCLFCAALGPFQAATPEAFALFLTVLAPFAAVIAAAGLLAPPCALLEKVVGRRYVGSTSLAISLTVVLLLVLLNLGAIHRELVFRVIHDAPYHGTGPTSSPDGSRIVFGSSRDGAGDIVVTDTTGAQRTRLTRTRGYEGQPSFAPDGSRIVFISDRDGNREVYVMNAEGTGQVRLTRSEEDEGDPSFAPDGLTILFDRQGDLGSGGVWIMNTDGSSPVHLARSLAGAGSPAWSPDGGVIVFDVRSSRGSPRVWVMNADGSRPHSLRQQGFEPSFSPDGKRITFVSDRAVPYQYEVWVMDRDGSNARQLTHNAGYNSKPRFTPDGRSILYANDPGRDGRWQIEAIGADGSHPRVILKDY